MNRIPCGGFNIGDGLTVDPVTRTLSALGGSSGANAIHFTWNDSYTEILSADKTVSEIIGNTTTGESYELDNIGFCQVLYTAPADEQEDATVVFYRVEPSPIFNMSGDVNGCDLLVHIIKGTAKNSGDVWKYYTNNFFINMQKGIVLRSPGNKVFELKVNDAGTISATELTT